MFCPKHPRYGAVCKPRVSRGQLRRVIFACAAGLMLTLLAADACPDTLDVMVITSAAADLGTTEWALGRPGLREANPLLQGPPERALAKAAGTILIVGAGRVLERHGHRGWSRAIRIAAVMVWGGCAANNAARARGAKP